MKKDNLNHQISKLPKQYMGETQKKKNWTQIQSKLRDPSRRKHWFAYPITAVVFGLFIFILFLNFGERGMVNAPEKENEMTEYVTVFEGHEPFVDIRLISNTLKTEYELSEASGYIINAAIFLNNKNEEVNPIKNKTPIETLLNKMSVNEEQIMFDSKSTWVYLGNALDILKEYEEANELKEKIENWRSNLEEVNHRERIQHNQEKYKSVSEELVYLARAIQKITPDSIIYSGQGEQWDINLQHIDENLKEEKYLITLMFKGDINLNTQEGIGQTKIRVISDGSELYSQNFYIKGVGGTYTDFNIPFLLENKDELSITIEWSDSEEEIIQLNKEVY